MEINKAKNYEGIKGIDAELEKIKEKVINPDCLCNNGTNAFDSSLIKIKTAFIQGSLIIFQYRNGSKLVLATAHSSSF